MSQQSQELWNLICDLEASLAWGYRDAERPAMPEGWPLSPVSAHVPGQGASPVRIGVQNNEPVMAGGAALSEDSRADGAGRVAALEELCRQISSCERCRLAAGRTRAVPGVGVLNPQVMVIGEGPGAEEDAQGLPFVGPAGQFLDTWLKAVGMDRATNVYIANIVKCRPPSNRDPADDEAVACEPWLSRQIELVRPRIILTVGRIATWYLLKPEGRPGITTMRGRWYRYGTIPVMPTYHPSAVLRDPDLKRPVWEDLKKVKKYLDHGTLS